MREISYGKHSINLDDIKLVSKSLKAKLITTGNYVLKFEKGIKRFVKSKYAVSCNSGTSALHLALLSVNLKKNDVVIMPSINFIAAYSMSSLLKAKVYLADVDPVTGQMTKNTLLECIRKNKIKDIKVIITMYLGGYPESVLDFYKIKKKYKCFLIEDACHAFGAKYEFNNKYINIGSCKHSDISVFSFHPVKSITTGEGGAITTNSRILAKRMTILRSHGIIKDKNNYWKYNINQKGFNYRISDINCALGVSQLKKANKFINSRKLIYNFYKKNFSKFTSSHIRLPDYTLNTRPSYHLFLLSINFSKIKSTKDRFLIYLKKNKIFCQYHYIPIYKFGFFNNNANINKSFFKGAEYYYKNTLSLPIYTDLKLIEIKYILNKINNFFKRKI
jgi:dTDP-4-amino-4,6-dideoxygalactose transaminase